MSTIAADVAIITPVSHVIMKAALKFSHARVPPHLLRRIATQCALTNANGFDEAWGCSRRGP